MEVEELNRLTSDYLKVLDERSKKSRVYRSYQLTGLRLAELLEDNKHKSLYIRLAKKYDNQKLIQTAEKVAEKKEITNKGAYFMKVWFGTHPKNDNSNNK